SKKAVLDTSRCIGCGGCVPTCPTKAMQLVRKPETDYLKPSKNWVELMFSMERRISPLLNSSTSCAMFDSNCASFEIMFRCPLRSSGEILSSFAKSAYPNIMPMGFLRSCTMDAAMEPMSANLLFSSDSIFSRIRDID
ncbi:MAG: 4Fe-4S binding protein, partial [Desulfamplus sp.]|nr:4Fe-4S binding protein [Desulfamplus sp.]